MSVGLVPGLAVEAEDSLPRGPGFDSRRCSNFCCYHSIDGCSTPEVARSKDQLYVMIKTPNGVADLK